MYNIYHIPGVKIGCTRQKVSKRVKQQGYTNFEILETHTDINIASDREIELQKQYGYSEKFIKTDYKQQIEFGKKGQLATKGKPGKGAKYQIQNKIGMFGYSKEERLVINTKTNIIRAQRAKEVLSKPIKVYDYKTGKYISKFNSIHEAGKLLNANNGNIHSVLNGSRNHTKGYTFKYA
jgi:hypothetical protein